MTVQDHHIRLHVEAVHSLAAVVEVVAVALFSSQLQLAWQLLVQDKLVDIVQTKVKLHVGTRLTSYFRQRRTQNLPLLTATSM